MGQCLLGFHSCCLIKKGIWDFVMFLVSTKNQTWQSETSMASSANCGQLNERESSREAVWGVCWWADNVTWCDCCQAFIASLVNHSELPLVKSPVGCQEPKPSRKPPCYSISWVLMSSLRQGRACRLMFSVPLRGTLMFRPPTRVHLLLSKRQNQMNWVMFEWDYTHTATRAVQGAFQRRHNRFPLSQTRASYKKIHHLISFCAHVFFGEASFDRADIVSWKDTVTSFWQLTGKCFQMLLVDNNSRLEE